MAYLVSENTRRALIMAAGELFSQRDVNAVSVREITAKAGVKVNAISYHFGGKDGLVDAVINYALKHWHNEQFVQCYQKYESQLDSPEGQRQVIIELLKIYYEMNWPRELPAWNNRFLLRLLSENEQGRERIAAVIRQVPLNLFTALFQRITGCQDEEIAYGWFINVIGAAAVYSSNLLLNRTFSPENDSDRHFYHTIRYWGIRNALQGLGLYDEKRDSSIDAFDHSCTSTSTLM